MNFAAHRRFIRASLLPLSEERCEPTSSTGTGTFSRINPYYRDEVILTEAEFGLFFEGANLEKRFIESPAEIRKKSTFSGGYELQVSAI